MTPQELKNSILQLAIQGKLVEQRPEEGTAAELLEKILSAKNAKGAKTNLTRRRGERGEKKASAPSASPREVIPDEEKPFDIPESWEWVRLGDLLKVIGGVSYDKKDVCNTGLRILRGGNIQNMEILLDDADVFLPEQYRDDEKIVRVGDILIVASTGSKTVIGKAGYVDKPIPQTMIGAFLRICRPSTLEFVDYLRIIFTSDFYRKHIRELSQGTNINNIKEAYITQFAIPLPPLAEQKRIVAKIEELLPLIDRYEKAWSKLEDFNKRFPVDMQKSLLQMAIQGKLVEQRPEEGTGEELYRQIQAEKQRLIKSGKIKKEKPLPAITEDEIPFEIPDSWKWVRLANIWSVLNGDRGKNYPAKSTLSHKGIPFISAINLDGKSVVKDDNLLCLSDVQYERLGNGKLVRGDVVVCIRGSLGKHGRYPFEKGAIASSLVIMRSQLELSALDDFLMLYLDTPLFFGEIKRYDNGTAQPNLAAKSLEQFLIPLPPLAEQKRIVAKLEEILPLCERLKGAVKV